MKAYHLTFALLLATSFTLFAQESQTPSDSTSISDLDIIDLKQGLFGSTYHYRGEKYAAADWMGTPKTHIEELMLKNAETEAAAKKFYTSASISQAGTLLMLVGIIGRSVIIAQNTEKLEAGESLGTGFLIATVASSAGFAIGIIGSISAQNRLGKAVSVYNQSAAIGSNSMPFSVKASPFHSHSMPGVRVVVRLGR